MKETLIKKYADRLVKVQKNIKFNTEQLKKHGDDYHYFKSIMAELVMFESERELLTEVLIDLTVLKGGE